ncbi:hypothetical protein HF1_08610 [Mycoplasma haemofelis str. Langford 1]|uniref:Uncharacterized protein n=1 Tax=Mycoplasma haemofelis (strain Langford 1) TaxID=941640 RepID=E8ZI98_MYCHL|nr:hypothetical protein HF1_08610 [Mycoplasma haemofelis str. Langford 1]
MNTGFKAAALAGGVGSAAGAGALAHKLSQDQRATIQDLFSNPQLRFFWIRKENLKNGKRYEIPTKIKILGISEISNPKKLQKSLRTDVLLF